MKILKNAAQRFLHDESGVTAIEYSLIASAVALGIVVPVAGIGDKLDATYAQILSYFATVGV